MQTNIIWPSNVLIDHTQQDHDKLVCNSLTMTMIITDFTRCFKSLKLYFDSHFDLLLILLNA